MIPLGRRHCIDVLFAGKNHCKVRDELTGTLIKHHFAEIHQDVLAVWCPHRLTVQIGLHLLMKKIVFLNRVNHSFFFLMKRG